jgi:hypothetical protein
MLLPWNPPSLPPIARVVELWQRLPLPSSRGIIPKILRVKTKGEDIMEKVETPITPTKGNNMASKIIRQCMDSKGMAVWQLTVPCVDSIATLLPQAVHIFWMIRGSMLGSCRPSQLVRHAPNMSLPDSTILPPSALIGLQGLSPVTDKRL